MVPYPCGSPVLLRMGLPVPNFNRQARLPRLPVPPDPCATAQVELQVPPLQHRERLAAHFLHQALGVAQAPDRLTARAIGQAHRLAHTAPVRQDRSAHRFPIHHVSLPVRQTSVGRPAGETSARLARHPRPDRRPLRHGRDPAPPAGGRVPPGLRKASAPGALAGARHGTGWEPPPARRTSGSLRWSYFFGPPQGLISHWKSGRDEC